MIQLRWFQRKPNAVLVIALSIAGSFSDPLSLLAAPQNSAGVSTEPKLIQFALSNLKDPPNRGTPRGTVGTGSRGDCLSTTKPLTLLAGGQGLEQTVSGHPTFWVYVPYAPDETTSGEFSLQEGEEEVYRAPFQLPPSPGIVSIVLPNSVAPLQPGKEYRWYVDINCPSRKPSRNSTSVSVTGIVKRVAMSATLAEDLGNAKTPLQRAASYARHGLWFDTLTELAHLRLKQPHNHEARQAWIELFSDRNDWLRLIAHEAITGSVITSSPPK
ncbi:DUF928 domain-containing protein [Leptothermofonsia sp. ETS-13]|uniref:DUF928 domain-containing protein n=1 Tax=Leptothermofonsia sp. ETS-13 TaxID=3035696 RepID=UPI003B9EDCFE